MKTLSPPSKSSDHNVFSCIASLVTTFVKRSSAPLGLKRIVTILILFFLSYQFVSAQIAYHSSSRFPGAVYDFYNWKNKTNNTTGWLLLMPGTTMTTVKGLVNSNNSRDIFNYQFNPKKRSGFGFIGTVMALTSIPFFISAGNNRKKAFLSLKREKVEAGNSGSGNFHYVAIDFKMRF